MLFSRRTVSSWSTAHECMKLVFNVAMWPTIRRETHRLLAMLSDLDFFLLECGPTNGSGAVGAAPSMAT